MRAMDPSIVRARAETRDGARARDRSASLSSCGTGMGDASGQDSDGDYLSAVDIAPYHGKSILTSQAEKISVDDFMPITMENFENACKLVSEGSRLEERVRQYFRAQYKDTKATIYDLQSKYYKTELALCKDALNRELQSLAKETETQKSEKLRLSSILRLMDERETEKINANSSLKLMMEGFKSSVKFDKEYVD